VVRTGLAEGLEVFGVLEGLQGLVDGGGRIRSLSSADVGGILHRGGTVLGTARSEAFRTRDGRRQAVRNLVERGIDGLVVVGGDGSLTGADTLRQEWSGLLDALVDGAVIDAARADAHRRLALVGLVGSIDNDMVGTDMTIGADTALHRITEAVDAIGATASSHQRAFVIEVMGRHCGYLALMGGLATGANFVLIPERPPEAWEEAMAAALRPGREIGRRASIVVVAEGARDERGERLTAEHVRAVLAERLGEDARITILGHLQRGGAPSAFDRYLATVLGWAAVRQLLDDPAAEPQLVGIRGHRLVCAPLERCVAATRRTAEVIAAGDHDAAMELRGGNFAHSHRLLATLVQARPRPADPGRRELRLAVLHAGPTAPGMNTAVRVALRVGMDRGHRVLAVRDGFEGLLAGSVEELDWMSVSGWVSRPGAELGTGELVPGPDDLVALAAQLVGHRIDGLVVIGGWSGYVAAHRLAAHLASRAADRGADGAQRVVPIVCVPASINNDLPASDLSIGADTALNSVMTDVDKVKDSAVGAKSCFVVEVMGGDCGFLALLGGVTTGAEGVYLPEEGISLRRLLDDLDALRIGFSAGKRRGLLVRGERSDPVYTTPFVESLLAREGGGAFDVHGVVLGRVQQGGAPSPFDRIQATRLAAAAVDHLVAEAGAERPVSAMVGLRDGEVSVTPLDELPDLVEPGAERPRGASWWMALRPLADLMASPRGEPEVPR
jgi:6-phosphofructokinase 1